MLGSLFYILGVFLFWGIIKLLYYLLGLVFSKAVWIKKRFPNLPELLCQTYNLEVTFKGFFNIIIGPIEETHFVLTKSHDELVINYFFYPEGYFELQSTQWRFNKMQSVQEVFDTVKTNIDILQAG